MQNPSSGIQPYVLGSGRAADAMRKSLAILAIQDPALGIQPVRPLARGARIAPAEGEEWHLPVLLIANPPGLHAQAILAAEASGFRLIVTEKPACVSLEECRRLRQVRVPVAVCHGYRMMWGLQTLRKMIDSGELGQVFAIEGRYWQSSTAQRALTPGPGTWKPGAWKNDPALSGPFDAFLDVGTHWMDAVTFLLNELPSRGQVWLSRVNAERPHRDSHVQLALDYGSGRRVLGSISKTVHGAGNGFELQVLGTLGSARWEFLRPDEIEIGRGRDRTVKVRDTAELGSHQAAFHGLGWLEGYVEIFRQAFAEAKGGAAGRYPDLQENLCLLESMLSWQGLQ